MGLTHIRQYVITLNAKFEALTFLTSRIKHTTKTPTADETTML